MVNLLKSNFQWDQSWLSFPGSRGLFSSEHVEDIEAATSRRAPSLDAFLSILVIELSFLWVS